MKNDKRDSCRDCRHVFDLCPACLAAGKLLKRKYRVGKEPGRITAKARTGSSKRRNNRSARMRQRPSLPRAA